MRNLVVLIILIVLFILVGCNSETNVKTGQNTADSVVYADAETEPVESEFGEDAADDPAIWIHPTDPSKSRIIGTNKKAGLYLYNLDGEEVHFYPVGNVNNVDVRYGFSFNDGTSTDIVGTSNRSKNTIVILGIDSLTGELYDIAVEEFKSNVDEVYGFCLYHDPTREKHYAFVNGKDGQIEQWELFDNGKQQIDAKIVRKLQVKTQPEGMVADDELGYLYVGEEMRGIWKFNAGQDASVEATFIEKSGESNPKISYDIEGLALYKASGGKGYLIASSQGNFTYAIFERSGDNKYITSFSIGNNAIDGAEETDGLEVVNVNLGKNYPHGLLVVQDGYNYEGDSLVNQNFKLVDWEKIARLMDSNL